METAVSGIMIEDKRILLIKRGSKQKMQPGLWFVPGGRGENNETPEETIIREIKEELDIIFKPTKLFQNIEDYGYDIYKYIGTYSGQIKLETKEIDGYGWFNFNEAKNLDLAFDMKEVLEKLHKDNII